MDADPAAHDPHPRDDILIIGLILTHEVSPGYLVGRYNAAKSAGFLDKTDFLTMLNLAVHGDPHSVMKTGLFTLTLVPLARVAFCFLLFLRERDYAYVGFTAYVLIGLVVGILLGSGG